MLAPMLMVAELRMLFAFTAPGRDRLRAQQRWRKKHVVAAHAGRFITNHGEELVLYCTILVLYLPVTPTTAGILQEQEQEGTVPTLLWLMRGFALRAHIANSDADERRRDDALDTSGQHRPYCYWPEGERAHCL